MNVLRVRGFIVDAPVYPTTTSSMRCFRSIDVCQKTGAILKAELAGAEPKEADDDGVDVVDLPQNSVLVPGFIDCHVHASQFPFCGTGVTRPLMADDGFLKKYAFPTEDRFSDAEYANRVYEAVVRTTLGNGTTTAAYYATIHRPASVALAQQCRAHGQRALVGKIQMDQFSLLESYKHDDVDECCVETEAFLGHEVFHCDRRQGLKRELVEPVITPRFIPSCSVGLLTALGAVSRKHPEVMVQTHVTESVDEVAFAKLAWEGDSVFQNGNTAVLHRGVSLTKTHHCDLHALRQVGLVRADGSRGCLIAAHAVLMGEEEMCIAQECDVRVAHCPLSNFYFANGTLDVKKLLLRDPPIKTGLGTDVAGGYSPCMLNAMRSAVLASKSLHQQAPDEALTIFDALHLGTAGGAAVCSLDDVVGRFDVGMDFDAQVIDVPHWIDPFLNMRAGAPARGTDAERDAPGRLTPDEFETLERILHLAETRRTHVWVRGQRVNV